MNPVIAVVAAPNVTGNQDITTADLDGLTPKGALFIYSRGASDGAVTANAGVSYGVADAASQWAFANYHANGSNTQKSMAKSDKCILALEGAVVHSEASFVSFITEGVRINWTTVDATDAWLLTVVFFAGDDWECKVGNWTAGSPPTVALGWEPNCVIVGSTNRPMDGVAYDGPHCVLGANGWDSAGVRGGCFFNNWSNGIGQRATTVQGWHNNSASAAELFTTFGYGVLINRAATGFTPVESGVATAMSLGYLALKWTGRHARTGKFGIDDVTGDQTFTGIALIPKFVLLFPTQRVGTGQDPTSGNNVGLGDRSCGIVAIAAAKAGGFAHKSVYNASPPNEHSIALEDSIQLMAKGGSGTVDAAATLSSFQSDGLTLNFTTAGFSLSDGQTHYWAYLALGPITEDEDEEPVADSVFAAIID